MGLEFDGSGAGLGTRCKRFAMLVDDGVIKALNVEDSPGSVEVTNADKLLAEL
jgi:peroxiredoxin